MGVKEPPPMKRLTVTGEVVRLINRIPGPIKLRIGVKRPDGKWDIAVPFSTYDQLQTAALPQEDLSDTVKRLKAYSKWVT